MGENRACRVLDKGVDLRLFAQGVIDRIEPLGDLIVSMPCDKVRQCVAVEPAARRPASGRQALGLFEQGVGDRDRNLHTPSITRWPIPCQRRSTACLSGRFALEPAPGGEENRRMNHVMTLVAADGGLGEAVIAHVRRGLRAAGALLGATATLAPRRAIDLPFAGLDAPVAEAVTRRCLGNAAVDLLAQPIEGRAKRLVIADLESTVIENEMLDDMAARIGVGEQVARVTEQAMRGELDFAAALEARLRLFAGQPASLLDQVAAGIRLSPGAEALFAGLHAAGVATALVTGGFDVFADEVARRLGIGRVFANRLEIEGGRLTGRALPPIYGKDAKRDALLALCAEQGIEPRQTVAVGDGANDLAMLAAAGLGVAYRAKPAVRAAARAHIDHTGLDTVLAYLGLGPG